LELAAARLAPTAPQNCRREIGIVVSGVVIANSILTLLFPIEFIFPSHERQLENTGKER
jgi:hypothetical protein